MSKRGRQQLMVLALCALVAGCAGTPAAPSPLARADIVNGTGTHRATRATLARYDDDAGACSAGSVQLLPAEAVDALTEGWKDPDEDCTGPEKLRLPVYGDYPRSSQLRRLPGSAHVLVRLDAEGRIDTATAVCATNAEFGAAAVETVKKIRFSPMVCRGVKKRIAIYLPLDYDI